MNLQVDLSVGHIIFCGMFTTSLLPCLLVIQWKTLLLVWFPFVDFSTFFSVNASLACNSYISSWMLGLLKEKIGES
jgi:hypothetical protein